MEQESNTSTDHSTSSEINEDYISKLPDEILEKILSIHPMDSGSKAVAVFTGLLNRPCIKRGGTSVKIQDFESLIGDFLVGFDEKYPLKMPRKVEFHFSNGSMTSIITASLGLNKLLNLDFSKGNQEFPRQFGWDIVLNTMNLAHSCPNLFSVKTLKLTSVNYLCYELVSSLINKFRYVESLIVEKCDGLRYLTVVGPKLQSLSVSDCVDLKSMHLEALELKSLRYNGFLCWFSTKSVDLKDVKLDFKGPGFNYLNSWLYDPLLRSIRNVNALTLHGWMFKDVLGPLLSLEQNEQHFEFSKLEDLWWIDSCMEDDNINSLLHFLKFCTSLKRLFISIDTQSYSVPCIGEHVSYNKIQKGRIRKLKVVKVEGFEKEVDIMLLNERLMEVYGVEPRLVLVRKGMQSRCLLRIPKRQAFGKTTESRKLKFSYKFVEEVEDKTGLCSKHTHMP